MRTMLRWLGPRAGRDAGTDPLDVPLLQLGKQDVWTFRNACSGTAIFGATGSGKSSGSGAAIAKSFLRAGFGGLVLTAKKDEVDLWRGYCRETGRLDSLVVFSPEERWRFNFLDYELSRPGAGAGLTENLTRLFMAAMSVADRSAGKGQAQDFWDRTTRQLLRNALDLLSIARGQILLHELYDLIVSAPTAPDDVDCEAWRESSLCWRCIQEGENKTKTPRQENDFGLCVKYWLKEFPGLAERTRSIIMTNLTSMLDVFLRGTLRELYCTTTNITPEDTHKGNILILDLPIKEYSEVGQMAQVLFKLVWQRASERRDIRSAGRVCFLWADEAQFFADPRDAEFQSTARSSRIATVYLSQNINSYFTQIGQAETYSIMGNLQTKFFHANGDPMTNHWAAELFSKSWQSRGSHSSSKREGISGRESISRNFSTSDSLDFEVLPREFTTLKTGGPENDYEVEAISFQGGRIWHATQKNHIKVAFDQR